MKAHARRRSARSHDNARLPFADHSFDLACSAFGALPFVTDSGRVLREVARVLRPGAPLVASDSLGSYELKAHHEGDTYNPVDPATLPSRLAAAGFDDVDVRTNELGWAVIAKVAPITS